MSLLLLRHLTVALLCCLAVDRAWAQALAQSGANAIEARHDYLTVTLENDLFVGRDDGYTGGFSVGWGRGPFRQFGADNTTELVARLAPPWIRGGDGYLRAVSHRLMMLMMTPQDISAPIPPAGDQPYAGLLLWRSDVFRFRANVSDRAWLQVGLVGPDSGAGRAQELVHRVTGSAQPLGWAFQLDDEPVFNVGIAHNWRAWSAGDALHGADLVLLGAASAGNFETQIDGGFMLRGGRNLARTVVTAGLLPGRDVNPLAGSAGIAASLFAGVLWRQQAWSLELDGNFDDAGAPPVHRRSRQYYYAGGLCGAVGELGWLLSVARSSRLYNEAARGEAFGSLSLTWRY